MAYDARQIANWFIERANADGKSMSIMALLKLTYIAHGWHLEVFDEPLIQNQIEVWRHGPVITDIYHEYRKQGVYVTKPSSSELPPMPEDVEQLLTEVWEGYSSFSAYQLSDLTHVKGGPWDIVRKTAGDYAVIPNDLIKQHYRLKRLEMEREQKNA